MKFLYSKKLGCLILIMMCLSACTSEEQKQRQIVENKKANELTEELIQHLKLDETQAEQVETINLEAAAKSTELKMSPGDSPRKLIEGSKLINRERNIAIKELLTPAQILRMKEMQKRKIKGVPITAEADKETDAAREEDVKVEKETKVEVKKKVKENRRAQVKEKKKKSGAGSKNSMKVAMELAEFLDLNVEQTIAVRALYGENAKQKHAAKMKAAGNADKLAASRIEIAENLDAKLLEIISPEQLALFKTSRSKK